MRAWLGPAKHFLPSAALAQPFIYGQHTGKLDQVVDGFQMRFGREASKADPTEPTSTSRPEPLP